MSEIHPGDRVSFYRSYGLGELQDDGEWVYRKRKAYGTVHSILPRTATNPPVTEDVVFINEDNVPQYSGLLGVQISKVSKIAKR